MPVNRKKQLKLLRMTLARWRRQLHPDRWLLPFASGVACISLLLGFIAVSLQTDSSKPKLLPLGSMAKVSGTAITVRSVRYDAQLPPGLIVPTGMRIATLDVEVDNLSDKTITFLPALQSYVRDAQAAEWTMTPAQVAYPLPAGEIHAHAMIRGEISYLIPQKTNGLWWYVERLTKDQPPIAFEVIPTQE